MGKLVSIVIDSYDYEKALHMIADDAEIKTLIELNGSKGGFTIFRPDSGDPIVVLPKMLHILEKHFGAPKNDKGYKVLNNVRIIWGDGINALSIASILRCVVDVCGYSADNIAFGMGGALLGAPQRDDLSWAMKCSSVGIRTRVPGSTRDTYIKWREVFKDPVTDSGKKSKRGRVTLWDNGAGEYQSAVFQPTNWSDNGFSWQESLVTYFEDGEVMFTQTVDEVRANTML